MISIIVPVYNVAEYIDRCVESLLAQTYNNLEIILINDGSTDNSGEVCRRLLRLHSDKVRFIEQENKGVSAARNAGLDIFRGKYVMFVDADDWVDVSYVEKLYDAIISNVADLSVCGFIEWHSDQKQKKHNRLMSGVYGKESFYKEIGINQVPMCTTLYKAEIINKSDIRFDTLLRRMEDGCFVADYCSYCERFVAIPEHLYYYYQRQGSAINSYHESTLLGVERSAYIIEVLEKAYNRSTVGIKICERHFVSKWVNIIPGTAVCITNRKNTLKQKEKREFLKKSIEISKIKERLSCLDLSKCALWEKLLARWTMKERIGLLLIYGKLYNILRCIKHIVKG